MNNFNFLDFFGVLADAAAKKATTRKSTERGDEKIPNADGAAIAAPEKPITNKRSFADKKTVVEMIRNHDALSKKISEKADNGD